MPSRAVQSRTEPPTDLPAASRELWSQLVAEHPGLAPSAAAATAPNASELLVLRAVVDVVARLEEVRQAIASEGLVVDGSQGQPRDHPLQEPVRLLEWIILPLDELEALVVEPMDRADPDERPRDERQALRIFHGRTVAE